jgi:hypothetical protein
MTIRPERRSSRTPFEKGGPTQIFGKTSLKQDSLSSRDTHTHQRQLPVCVAAHIPHAKEQNHAHAPSSNAASRMRRRHLIRILIWPGVAHIKKIAAINIYEADIAEERDRAPGPVCHVNMSESVRALLGAFCLRCMFSLATRGGGKQQLIIVACCGLAEIMYLEGDERRRESDAASTSDGCKCRLEGCSGKREHGGKIPTCFSCTL